MHKQVLPEALPAEFERLFPDRRFIVVSNREPYEHACEEVTGNVVVRRPAGGLTSALDPMMQAIAGDWGAWVARRQSGTTGCMGCGSLSVASTNIIWVIPSRCCGRFAICGPLSPGYAPGPTRATRPSISAWRMPFSRLRTISRRPGGFRI